MRRFQLALICFICIGKSYGQAATRSYGKIVVEITKEKKPKKIYTKVEIILAFTGGDTSWIQSLEKTLDQSIPFKNGAKAGKYFVSVQFIVDKDSSISDIVCLNNPAFGMCEEVKRAIMKKPKWRPSSQGVPVSPYRISSSTPSE